MPKSCKCILDRMVHKGAMTKEERDKIVRNLKTQDEEQIERLTLSKIEEELADTGAYEQEVNGNTDFLKGIQYCLDIIHKFKEGENYGKSCEVQRNN